MTIHGHTFAGPRGAAAVLSAVLLATATATALPLRSDAATACGGTASDILGRFVSHGAGPAGTPSQGYQGAVTVTFSAPNTVSADRQVTDPSGHTAWSGKGSGVFTAGPPLSWTENGTYTYNENQQSGNGTYQLAFKASQDTCTTGTQVSSFTGTYTDPKGTPVGQPQTYTRQP
jgi:hypothetical protein